MHDRIGVVAARGFSTSAILRALGTEFPESQIRVIYEAKRPRGELMRRRARKLGWASVIGQLAFRGVVHPILARSARKRTRSLQAQIEAAYPTVPDVEVRHVPSVNSPEAREALKEFQPGVVLVSGTRIISRDTLSIVPAPFINMHAGITPAYRGGHGGYWALVERRMDLAGTTVHLVDTGIDTGNVIQQILFTPTDHDNFATYPMLHIQVGLPAFMEATRSVLNGEVVTRPLPELPSKLRHHPTIWAYFWYRITRGVR